MSIRDNEDNEVLTLNNFWGFMAKVALTGFVPLTLLFISLNTWTITQIFDHSTRLALLERDSARYYQHRNGAGVSQSVNVGQAGKEMAKSGREYLTVAEVALRENVAERTITDWIAKGRIEPLPMKKGKEYTIAAEYRVLPQDAACCGTDDPSATVQVQTPPEPKP